VGQVTGLTAVVHRLATRTQRSETMRGQLHMRKPPDACNAEGLLTHRLDDPEKEG